MPIYDYRCPVCGTSCEVFQKLSDPPPDVCEHCGAATQLQKQISPSSFQLKGGGWYKDLYSSSNKSDKSE